MENLDECHDNSTCENTVGSYTCTCIFGFEGDGFNCIGIYIHKLISVYNNTVNVNIKAHKKYFKYFAA